MMKILADVTGQVLAHNVLYDTASIRPRFCSVKRVFHRSNGGHPRSMAERLDLLLATSGWLGIFLSKKGILCFHSIDVLRRSR